MAYTTIKKPSDYFNGTAYTGNGTAGRDITLATFQPDFTWIKSRSDTDNHRLVDAVRGATKHLQSDTTDAEQTSSNVTAFTSDGVTLSSNGAVNANSETYMSWNWLGANGTTANTDGSISSTVSANTTSGFSIVKFTASGSGDETVGHGLGVKPKMVITKSTSTTNPWNTYNENLNSSAPEDYYVALNSTNGSSNDSPGVFGAGMTSSTIGVGVGIGFTSGEDYIAYCFAEKKGFSKFGSYNGNGNADGTFVYTGFKPAFVMIKETNTNGTDWRMMDNKRSTFNLVDDRLFPNLNNVENTGDGYDFLSNGFKIRSSGGDFNGSGDSYIYMCFAEAPLVGTNNVPCTAR